MKPKEQHQFRLWFDRLLSKSLLQQLGILAIGLILAFVVSFLLLSFSGAEWQAFCDAKKMSRWLLPLYLLIDSNALNNLYIDSDVHGWMLFASSITFLVGAFIFNGAIIGIITNSIEQRVTNHCEGHIHYLKSGHYIIMGYDDMVPSIITHIFEQDSKAYVLLLSAAEAPYIREKLKRSLGEECQKHIIINYGHRMSTDYYKDINLEAAEEVYIVGLQSLPAHDAVNVECVDSICQYLNNPEISGHPNHIVCVFKDLDTYAAFKTSDIFSDQMKKLGIEFIPYNFYTGWAKQVFVKRQYRGGRYPAVYGKGITPDDPKRVHLVFVGTTNFAVAFAMEAAHLLHFPNFVSKGVKTLITFIDINADKEKEEFVTRNRHLFEVLDDQSNFLDLEFEFIQGDIFSRPIQELVKTWATSNEEYLSIFLAMSNQRQNYVMGMNMPDEVYDNEVPIFIRQDKSDNLVTNLRNADAGKEFPYSLVKSGALVTTNRHARYANIYPFGMNDTAYCADERALRQAKLINYLYDTADYSKYKFQSIETLESLAEKKIKADADERWAKLSVALKWSNLYSAYALETKAATLRAMRGFDIDDRSHDQDPLTNRQVEVIAEVEHNRWNVEKLLMGYRRPTPEEDSRLHLDYAKSLKKNKDLFIHNDIRPYKDLGDIQELDREFTRYIPWILKMSE
jgi:hypothetical protein